MSGVQLQQCPVHKLSPGSGKWSPNPKASLRHHIRHSPWWQGWLWGFQMCCPRSEPNGKQAPLPGTAATWRWSRAVCWGAALFGASKGNTFGFLSYGLQKPSKRRNDETPEWSPTLMRWPPVQSSKGQTARGLVPSVQLTAIKLPCASLTTSRCQYDRTLLQVSSWRVKNRIQFRRSWTRK